MDSCVLRDPSVVFRRLTDGSHRTEVKEKMLEVPSVTENVPTLFKREEVIGYVVNVVT